jgi:hypothetical protein
VGSNPTPSAKSIEIIEQFGSFGAYAQSNVQILGADIDVDAGAVLFIIFMIAIGVLALWPSIVRR